jgi:spermidine synthase
MAARSRTDLPEPKAMQAALAVCFLFSGLASLVLEVVWTRLLQLVFGSTTLAVSTILAAYMLGMGIGGLLGGRFARRLGNGVRIYGWLEIGIAACAVAVPWVIDLLPGLSRVWSGDLPQGMTLLLRFALSLAVLLAPTLLMGATLPLLVSALVHKDERVGASVGLLYGVNTLGAVTGVFAATFVLLPSLGVWGASFAGGGVSLAVGLLAVIFLAPGGRPRGQGRALVGFTALSYEVGWTRALSMVLGSSIYAFASMLAAFLAGISLGSLLAGRFVDSLRRPLLAYAVGITALAVLSVGTTFLLPHLPGVFLWTVRILGTSPVSLTVVHVGISILAMLPPTLVLGALFPLLVRALAGRSERASPATGEVYCVNTLGSAIGAFASGFVLIPWIGLQGTLLLAACLNLLSAAVLLIRLAGIPARTRAMAVTALVVLTAALFTAPPSWNPRELARGVFYEPLTARQTEIELLPLGGVEREELLFYRDGLSSSVSVHRNRGEIYLRVNGKTDASSARDMPTQVLLGQIPLLFGGRAHDVLVIGYASGVTVGSVARHAVEQIDAVEIEPAMIEASRFYDAQNGRPLDDRRVHLLFDDGRSFLSYTDRRYDAIISEPSNPWMSGVSNLFTQEFFRAARRALTPGGRLVQWLHLYGMDMVGVRALLAAVRAEFPYVYGFAPEYGSGDLILMATLQPLGRTELPRWEQLSEDVREDLRRVGSFSTYDLWSLIRLRPRDIDALLGQDAPVNRDGNLFIELRAPWTLYQHTTEANWREFSRFELGVLPLLLEVGEPLNADRIAALSFSYLAVRGDIAVSEALLREADERGPSAHGHAVRVFRGRHYTGLSIDHQLALLDEALGLNREAIVVHLLRAEVLSDAGRNEEALVELDSALRSAPRDPEAQAVRAVILRRLGRSEEAAAATDALLGRPYADLHPGVWSEAARNYLAAGRLPDGIRVLERYLEAEPHSPVEWSLLASLFRRAGQPEEAVRAERNSDIARRNRARLLHRRGRRAFDAGNRELAANLLERAVQLDPEYESAREELRELRR